MKHLLSAIVFSIASVTALAGSDYSVSETTIGVLMKDPAARAVLEKHLPDTTSNAQFAMAEGFTLEFIAGFDQTGELSAENLTKINQELAALKSE